MRDKLSKEDLWDECVLAFNSALQRANDLYPDRWERINQAKEQIKALICEDNIKRDMIIDNRLGIKKPEVTEEWIEEKAVDFLVKVNISVQNPEAVKQQLKIIKDFIQNLLRR